VYWNPSTDRNRYGICLVKDATIPKRVLAIFETINCVFRIPLQKFYLTEEEAEAAYYEYIKTVTIVPYTGE